MGCGGERKMEMMGRCCRGFAPGSVWLATERPSGVRIEMPEWREPDLLQA